MIKAWLDDYKVIHVVNTQKFPSDPAFSMRLNNQTLTPESRRLDARTYEVRLPKSLKLENTYYLKVNGEEILVEYRFVTKTKKFNDFFAYTGKLGLPLLLLVHISLKNHRPVKHRRFHEILGF